MGVHYPLVSKYPIVDPDPGVQKALQHFRSSDWAFVGGATVGFTVLGYFIGRPTILHRPTSAVTGLMGLSFGVCIGLQNSMGRLMGLCENTEEVNASKAAA